MARDRWATFDCYGTLIDWNWGIGQALSSLWPDEDPAELLASYHRIEPTVQAGRGIQYRDVLAQTLAQVAEAEGLRLSPEERDVLSNSLPGWPPFPETQGSLRELRERGWRLAILSNTDPDLLEASLGLIGVPVDLQVVASDIGSYKPSFAHWQTFFERSGAARTRHVHVAASLFHDVEPCAKLGLPCVWINRKAEESPIPRAGELTDLTELPKTLERLVPVREPD